MKINVAQQLKGPMGNSRQYTVDETSDDGLPINGKVKLVLTNRSILVTGQFRTIIQESCSRCLEEFEQRIEFEIEEEFFPTGNIFIADPLEEGEEIEGFIIGEDHIIDLSEAWRQAILLSLPRKPICRVDCLGLCPNCGCNLNKGNCNCQKQHFDSRLAPLKELLSLKAVENGSEVKVNHD